MRGVRPSELHDHDPADIAHRRVVGDRTLRGHHYRRAVVLNDRSDPRDSNIFIKGNAGSRGPVAPRRFLEVLSGEDREPFRDGSGRLELAKSIGTADNPLTARVIVNRIWQHQFGEGLVRTPKINQRGGRDHYPRAMFCVLGGGGLQGGQVVGESDAKGENPKDRAITPDDVAATFYRMLGIDSTKEYHTPSGRPVMIVRHGKPLKELIS